jgi:ATPase subunit of ABC transporter with duplicated ATPase domains
MDVRPMPLLVVSDLSWSTPDGRPLFHDLDLSLGSERVGLVGRNGVGKSTLMKLIAGELSPASGAVSVAGRLGVLRQEAPRDATLAELFGVVPALAILDRAEQGTATPEDLAGADWTLPARLAAALDRVDLAASPDTPLAALSGGQRTRAALAALVFAEPDLILLDEPTNHLDRDGRRAVADLLATWRAGALVVSHDRDLLDQLDAIVELTTLGARRYGGNWTAYRALKATELAAAEHDKLDAERRLADVDRAAQAAVERQARRDGVGKRKAAKGDMPRILAGGLKRKSEATSGRLTRVSDARRETAEADLTAARAKIEVLTPFAVRLPSSGLASGRRVARFEHVTAGYGPAAPVIADLSFEIVGPERVALTGSNGSGKSTILAVLTGALSPWAGRAAVDVPFALLDQEVGLLDGRATIRDNFRRLNPDDDENACRAALARFMFRADAALQVVGTLSGGEKLRAGLACVLGGARPPQLILLDEPTNHLDVDAIETVEAGLIAYDGALLVVSHDERFLANIGITRRLALPSRLRP